MNRIGEHNVKPPRFNKEVKKKKRNLTVSSSQAGLKACASMPSMDGMTRSWGP